MPRCVMFSPTLLIFLTVASFADEEGKKLVEAARSGDVAQVKQYLAGGVDVNSVSSFNITALWQATSKGHVDVAKVLLEAGADPNIRDEVWNVTPLMLADDREMVRLLVKHSANGVQEKLRMAALTGSAKLVEAILDARRLDEKSLAAAKWQAQRGRHSKIVKLLEEAAGKSLPPPPSVEKTILENYAGKYLSERLEEVEVGVRDDELTLRSSTGAIRRLVARDQQTFDFGSDTFTFQTRAGAVVSMTQSSAFRNRVYTKVASTSSASAEKEKLADDSSEPTPLTTEDWKQDNSVAAKDVWPSFRGVAARGIAVDQNLPPKWNVETGEGVRWKTPIPGLANSCPVVWRDKVLLTTAVSSAGNTKLRIGLYGAVDAEEDESEHTWKLFCIERDSGKILWERTAHQGVPPVKRHLKSSQANSTPATDGKYVVALFNYGGLHCWDIEGNLLWKKNLGRLDSGAFNDPDYQWGFGSSPIIYHNTVVVQCDLQKNSFLAAFEIATGEEIWRTPRDELPSWGTPTICETPRGPLLIANATNYVRGYDARTGQEQWRLGENAAITTPTPIVGRDLIFVTSGYRPIQPIYAVRLGADGDLTLSQGETASEHIAWSKRRGGPYLPTPLLYGSYLYTLGNNGVMTCYEAATGKRLYRKRAGKGSAMSFTASPVAADGKIYVTAEAGEVFAIQTGPKFERLSSHPVGEYCLATPAIASGMMFLRTQKHLVAIGREP